MSTEPHREHDRDDRASQAGQATVHDFDPESGTGSVITDEGQVIPFDEVAWNASPLRTLRLGQRLRIHLAGEGALAQVSSLTLVTFAD